ncbi:MAG: GGDEF domain-containing protein [Poseidonibacter sp.]|uniref:GGDEF domain-containing protein n=1 Tax=Poseidonibacter sp. TaxID=2321188 RepID=UPI00359D0C35
MTQKWTSIVEKLDYAFQPIIHSHTGKIFAVEALIRNYEQIHNINTIHELFDLAFSDDFLYEFDLMLREKAIKKFSTINVENLRLFYNLDNRIIYNKALTTGNTASLLKQYNLNKDIITFELSERGALSEQSALSTMIYRYKKNGYSIAIDDFGIGVSGLKLLYFSQADIIKLDKFFIRDIDTDSKKKLFCTSIIDMAHTMGIKVIAEGIETINEYYTCKDIGVDFIQGFLVQKPTKITKNITKVYNEIVKIIEDDKRFENTVLIDEKYIEKVTPLNVNTSLYDLFIHFKEAVNCSFVPIVDDFHNLLGVIYEIDIKKISYSKYGLSLAKNETLASTLKKYIKPVFSVEETWGVDKTLEMFNLNAQNSLGIFITKANKYKGYLNLNTLLTISYNRNIEIATNQNPLTKLPGNKKIESFIHQSLKNFNKETTHMLYFDFNDFKPFNDHYGFRQGDRAILIFAELLQKKYPKDSLIAHIGGDDFFVGIKNKSYEDTFALTCNVLEEFKTSIRDLYTQKDKDNGYILAKDRFNIERRFNLLSTCCGIIEITDKSKTNNFDHTLNIIKKFSKKSFLPLGASI